MNKINHIRLKSCVFRIRTLQNLNFFGSGFTIEVEGKIFVIMNLKKRHIWRCKGGQYIIFFIIFHCKVRKHCFCFFFNGRYNYNLFFRSNKPPLRLQDIFLKLVANFTLSLVTTSVFETERHLASAKILN